MPTETAGTIYSGPVNIGSGTTINAIAYASGFTDSSVISGAYAFLPQTAAPTFSPGGGRYLTAQSVTISTITNSATIRYTTDGSTPTEAYGTVYSGPINISGYVTLNAIAYESGFIDSQVTDSNYTIAPLNVLHDFAGYPDGEWPLAGLLQGSDGNFYSTSQGGGSNNAGTIFKITPGGALTIMASFDGSNGSGPWAGLVQGSDGNFYGTTGGGGDNNNGAVFMMTPTGVLTALASFNGANGVNPTAALVQGSDGNFYGTTEYGGSNNQGTVFRITPAGVLTTLVSFNGTNGYEPFASLIQGNDGNFYGTTVLGGSNNDGTVFKMTPAGVLTTLVTFNGTNGEFPYAGLLQASDGNFYGMTLTTVFKITPADVLTTMVWFNGTNGSAPQATLVQGQDGNFYGTTVYGGSNNEGTVFVMTPAGVLTTLVSFNGVLGSEPAAGLVQASDGTFYGTTLFGGNSGNGVVFQLVPAPRSAAPTFSPAAGTYGGAQTVTISTTTNGATIRYTTDGSTPTETNGTIYSGPVSISSTTVLKAIAYETGFTDSPATGGSYTIISSAAVSLNAEYDFAASVFGGGYPSAGLVQGGDGNFYGTTVAAGGANSGTVFQMTPAGVLTTLAWFTGDNGTNPNAGLVQGSNGNFYGTTESGGGSNDGTVFQLTPAGILTTLASFTGDNGANPVAGLVQGSDGNFYGTTVNGGAGNSGTVFQLTPTGVLTTLVSFNGANGATPFAGLAQGSDGNFYGTTDFGGSGGEGTVFRLTPAGILTTLVSFTGANGANPVATLIQGSDGNFYGTTENGGGSNEGTVFRLTPAGILTTLVSFMGVNGATPAATLIQGSDGNFYGTTESGGGSNEGTVFQMTPAGVLTTLVSFDGANGANPQAGLIQGNAGNFYGVTQTGGASNNGVFFQLVVPPQAVAPTFSPAAGTYTSVQTVSITSGTNGALIRYTIDGSTPTETHGTLYSGPVLISASTSFAAIAYAPGFIDSAVMNAKYTINLPKAVKPAFSPAPGTYASAQNVTITSATSGASIRYTTDGSIPSETNGTAYSGPVNISATTTLKAIAYKTGLADSTVTTGIYTITKVAAPVFSPAAGTYTSVQKVNVATATSGASIRYTTDGSTPTTTHGSLYSGQITISKTTTLKAIAYKTGLTTSAVTSGTYTLVVAAPVFSPTAGTYDGSRTVTITSTTSSASIRYTTDGSTPTTTHGTLYSGSIYIGKTTTLKAIAYETGFNNSPVTTGKYTIY